MDIHATLAQLVAGDGLNEQQAEALFTALLSGELNDAQIGAVLSLIQMRGARVAELTGAARAMRANVVRVPIEVGRGQVLIDTCGTGGAPKLFNVSTVAAIIAAAAGGAPEAPRVLVAKHGNRSRTGRGSAEMLAQLGINIDAEPETQARCLQEAGVCFSFAIRHHPAMRCAAGPRQSLGFRTIFNLLGPLTNPAGAKRQVIGVCSAELVEPMARTLATLGAERAVVAHGGDGLDELTTCACTTIAIIDAGEVRLHEIDSEACGLPRATHDALRVESLQEAVELAERILKGEKSAARDISIFNAAAALFVAGEAALIDEAIIPATDAVDSGAAWATLERLREVSHGFS